MGGGGQKEKPGRNKDQSGDARMSNRERQEEREREKEREMK